jgi:dTDP-4-amino-4,6-dideoxy-D-galactose acyltransferase
MLTPLGWDSEFFGFPVARIEPSSLDDESLARTLKCAQAEGFRLIYWAAEASRQAPPQALSEFRGLLVDRKAYYETEALDVSPVPPCLPVCELPRGPASPALIALSIASGIYSRFRVDPSVPAGKFEELYRLWIDRSTRGEVADAVLAASDADGDPDPAGFVALSVAEGEGQIHLIAVRSDYRGRGVGRTLVAEAHRWMIDRGATRAKVVTQLDNTPACRLYENTGYHLGRVDNVYHFWPTTRKSPL